MFFFQVTLLLGYIYAHVSTSYLSARYQLIVHLVLVVIAIVTLPIAPSESWRPVVSDPQPTWRLVGLLTQSVGLPFFLLSTTSPLLQAWWHRLSGDAPYRLYAWSNAGSFLALLSFPFVFEPILGVGTQIMAWSTGFFFLACATGYCAYRISSLPVVHVSTPGDATANSHLDKGKLAAWLALSTTGSILLLAMTSHLTQNVAVVPFLWVAPLALYLLSFILCFADGNYYRRWLFGGFMIASQIFAAGLYHINLVKSLPLLLAVYLAALFSGCMVCHGELARLRPSSQHLTLYFVVVSLGGALGGFLTSVVAPSVFADYYEYPLVLISCWGILFFAYLRDKKSPLYRGKRAWGWLVLAACLFFFLTQLRDGVILNASKAIKSRRSFYGVLSVQADEYRGLQFVQLSHGIITHGLQHLSPQLRNEPTSYYQRESGLGYAIKLVAQKPGKRVGLLGLGIGTIAAYAEKGDIFRAYEINPDVVELALDTDLFGYWSLLEERGARGDIILGDARISLANELDTGNAQEFDLLVLDVFSGDAIPVHLLTVEAFQIYKRHLATHGFLAIHISNRHLDLLPVVQSMAEHFSMSATSVYHPESHWVILGSSSAMQLFNQQPMARARPLGPPATRHLWTDDFSNLFSVLR